MSIPIFILTLKGDDERRKPLIDFLEAGSVSFEIRFGIDGRKGLAKIYESMIDRDAARETLGRDMGNGEFACALSHHHIYREIIDRDLARALILEDDAILGEEFPKFLEHEDDHDFDLLVLDHRRADVFRGQSLHFPSGQVAYRLAFSPLLTTGYVVSNAGARTLLNESLPIAAPADWPINIADMKSYAINPRIVDHPDVKTGSSHIRTERTAAKRKRQSASRLLTAAYWKKKYRKIASDRIS